LYQECCTKSVVPSVLYKCVVPTVLLQQCCTKSVVAPSVLYQVCWTNSVVPSVLYQVCYASTQELEVMLQNRVRCVCQLKCQEPLKKITNFRAMRQMALQRAPQRALTITYASSSLDSRAPRDISEWVALCGLYQVCCVLYKECCTKCVVPSGLYQVCCTKCVVPRVLYQECCTKSVVPSVLYKCVVPTLLPQQCCTKSVVAPSVLYQMCCTKSVEPIVLCQVCRTKCVMPQRKSSKWCCRIACDVCVNSSVKTFKIKLRIFAQFR